MHSSKPYTRSLVTVMISTLNNTVYCLKYEIIMKMAELNQLCFPTTQIYHKAKSIYLNKRYLSAFHYPNHLFLQILIE